MMSDIETRLAETLAAHGLYLGRDHEGNRKERCSCGLNELGDQVSEFSGPFYAHQAAMLEPLIAEAQAVALEEAAKVLDRAEYARPEAPERAEYEHLLAIRRGGTTDWLRNRAAQIRGVES